MGLGVGRMQKWRNDMGREVIHEGFQGLLPDTTKRWLIFRNLPETAGPAAQTPPSLHAGGQDDASREQIPPNDTGPLNPRFIKCACVALHAPPPYRMPCAAALPAAFGSYGGVGLGRSVWDRERCTQQAS